MRVGVHDRTRTLVGFGLVNRDFVTVAESVERDHKARATHFFEQVGGPVPVALCAASRLGGVESVFLGVVGDDAAGREITSELAEFDVDARLQRASGVATSRSLVLLDARDGTRTLANYSETLPQFVFDTAADALLDSGPLLHIDGRDLDSCFYAARRVKASGGIVSYDLGSARPGRDALFPLCDIVLASRGGGAAVFPELAGDPLAQVAAFRALGVRIAGVTLAERGVALAADGLDPTLLPAHTPERVVDTCGAGDTFHGAFLWSFLRGDAPVECAQIAQAAVARRITHYGNAAGLPGAGEIVRTWGR